ncbi:zinc knuckle CX2CX4HX4C containing protein [Tanacetum coccineum]
MTGKVDALTFRPARYVGDENGSSMGGETHVRVSDNTNLKDREYLSIVSVHGNDSGVFKTGVDAGINYVPSSRPDVATSSHFSEAINSDCMRNASNVTTNMYKSPNMEEVSEFNDSKFLIHNIDDVANFFGVSLKSFKEIDDFTKELEAGNNQLWLNQITKTRSGILEISCDRWDTLVKLQENTQTVDDNPGMVSSSVHELRVDGAGNNYVNSIANINSEFSSKMETLAGYGTTLPDMVSPSDPIVWSIDINTKPKSYAGAAGASAKDQPTVSNFRPLVADPIFDGVNISIPRKLSKRLLHVLNTLNTVTLLEKEWRFRLLNIILLKKELTRIPIWVKLHDVHIQVFEEDGISLISTFIGKPIMLDSYTSSNWLLTIVFLHLPGIFQLKKQSVLSKNGSHQSTNGGQFAGHSVKQNVRYEPKATTSTPKKRATNVGNSFKPSSTLKTTSTSSKNDNIITSNSYSALIDEEEDEEEDVENVYDEYANLFQNTKASRSLSFTTAVG